MTETEVLFKIGKREIVKNGLYALVGELDGLENSREMVVAYNPRTNKSTWVEPKGRTFYASGAGLMATVISNESLEDAFNTPKPYLRYRGGLFEFDWSFGPTPEQIKILVNWYEELHKVGIGGRAPELSIEDLQVKDLHKKR